MYILSTSNIYSKLRILGIVFVLPIKKKKKSENPLWAKYLLKNIQTRELKN